MSKFVKKEERVRGGGGGGGGIKSVRLKFDL